MGQVPSYVDIMLDALQLQIENITVAMQSNLTPFANLASELKTVTLTHKTEREIKISKLKSKPFGVFGLWVDGNRSIDGLAWRMVDMNTIAVTVLFGNPDPGATFPVADVRFWIIGEGE